MGVMEIFYLIGFIILLYASWKHKDIIRIEWKAVASFLAFLAFLTCFRVAAFSFFDYFNLVDLMPRYPHMLEDRGMWRLFMVWWEDLFYVLPMFWIVKRFKKWLAFLLIFFLSMDFGAGHMYQGVWGVIVTSFYPYFISYRYGKKYGLGTVMVSHVIYDFATVFTIIGYYMYSSGMW